MVWEEIKRILAGADDEGKNEGKETPSRRQRESLDFEAGEELAYAVPGTGAWSAGGVAAEPDPAREGEPLTIHYGGLLAQQGAAGITLHCGYGHGAWTNVQDIPMHPVGYGKWQATVFTDRSGLFNFCFRDTAGHWDNNNGENWSVEVLPS